MLEPDNSEYLLSLLADSAFDVGQAAKIPKDIVIAHKFGETYYTNFRYFHDCGIMYINEKRIFYCIMTKGIEEDKAEQTIGVIVNKIYVYAKETDILLSKYGKK